MTIRSPDKNVYPVAELILYKNKLKKKIRALADTLNVLNLYLEPPVEWYKQDVGEDFFFFWIRKHYFLFCLFLYWWLQVKCGKQGSMNYQTGFFN